MFAANGKNGNKNFVFYQNNIHSNSICYISTYHVYKIFRYLTKLTFYEQFKSSKYIHVSEMASDYQMSLALENKSITLR